METQVAISEIDGSSKLINQALIEVNKARDVVIINKDDYSFAGLMYKEIKGWISRLDEEEKKITRPLLEGVEAARALFRGPKQKANEVKDILNQRMVAWAEQEEAIRREQESQLQEEARKRAEDEAIRQALEAEAAGEKQEAEEILKEEIYVPPVKVVSQVPKSKDSHIRETWTCQVVDLKALVNAIAVGKAPLECVTANITFLNTQARAYKQALNIQGVVAVSKKTQI